VVVGDPDASVAVVGWGSTWGAITSARRRIESAGRSLAHIHLRHLNPLPANLGDLLRSFERVVVPEMNTGQLCRMLRAEYLVDAKSVTKVSGQPFTAAELVDAITDEIGATGEQR
jgi:2-oxoglutarate ferredoxin oxidoreductase subunit alpha